MERLELAPKRGDLAEEFESFIHGHLEHFVDILALVGHLQRFAIVARTIAHFAVHVYIGKEVHLDLLLAVALARFAASTCNIEGKTAWSVATRLALLRGGEEVADIVPEADVGCWVGTRSATDRALIDADHLVDELYPFELLELAHLTMRAIHAIGERWGERVGNERALARARNTRDHRERTDRDLRRHILEVVLARTRDLDLAALGITALSRNGDALFAAQVLRRERLIACHDLFRGAARDHFATVFASTRTHIDHIVGTTDRILVVLDHEHRVT